jgi:hypothetical protein
MIHKRASLILVLIDGFTNSTSLKGVVNVRTENGIYAKNKGDGCYVFVDCYPGKYKIFVNPSVYENRELEVDIGENVQVRYVMLQPSRTYPLIKQAVHVSGRCNGKLHAALEGGAAGSVMEKYSAGDTEIKLYFSEMTDVLGRLFYFSDGKQHEVRRIINEEPENRSYRLEEALDFEIEPYTQILPVYEAYVKDGSYFLVVKKSYQKIYLLGDAGLKTLELEPGVQEYKFDYTEE